MKNNLTYENAYQEFKNEFKEDSLFFTNKEKETAIDDTDGAHLQFGMVIVPYLYHLVELEDVSKIKECFDFFDRMSTSSDKELSAVVQFSILENIVTDEIYLSKLEKHLTDEMKSYLPYLHSYIDFK